MCLSSACLFALRVYICDIRCLFLVLITKTNKPQPGGVTQRCCQPALMEKTLIKAQMVQRRAKYYQKLLSQQAALVSQPPARLNVSNPPPLWGLKFLLSTSGPAWWMQTGLEFCPHASSFLPYRTVPAAWLAAVALNPSLWELSGQTRRILNDSYGHCCFSVRPPSQNPSFITVGSLKGMILWNHHGSKCLLQSVTSTFSQPRWDSQGNGNLTSEGKVQFGLLKLWLQMCCLSQIRCGECRLLH